MTHDLYRNNYRVTPMLQSLRLCRQCQSYCYIAHSLSDRYYHRLRRTFMTLTVWTVSHPFHRKHTGHDKDEKLYHCIYHLLLVTIASVFSLYYARHETKFMYSSNQTQNITNRYAKDTTTHINISVSPTAQKHVRAWLPIRHPWQGQSCSRDLTTVPIFNRDLKIGATGSSETSPPT
jgi:hypothetical protein